MDSSARPPNNTTPIPRHTCHAGRGAGRTAGHIISPSITFAPLAAVLEDQPKDPGEEAWRGGAGRRATPYPPTHTERPRGPLTITKHPLIPPLELELELELDSVPETVHSVFAKQVRQNRDPRTAQSRPDPHPTTPQGTQTVPPNQSDENSARNGPIKVAPGPKKKI